jgi:hypothetical protein
MAIRQRNMGAGAVRLQNIVNGNSAAVVSSGTGKFLGASPRTSVQVDELSVTVGNCHTGTTTSTGDEVVTFRAVRNNYAAEGIVIATATVPVGSALGSEITTRDGTVAWQSDGATDYRNVSNRVFEKGTTFWAANDAGSSPTDMYIVSLSSIEFGAAPN